MVCYMPWQHLTDIDSHSAAYTKSKGSRMVDVPALGRSDSMSLCLHATCAGGASCRPIQKYQDALQRSSAECLCQLQWLTGTDHAHSDYSDQSERPAESMPIVCAAHFPLPQIPPRR